MPSDNKIETTLSTTVSGHFRDEDYAATISDNMVYFSAGENTLSLPAAAMMHIMSGVDEYVGAMEQMGRPHDFHRVERPEYRVATVVA